MEDQGTAPAGHIASNPSLYERLKPFAEQGGVSHQASVLPNMQLVAGRLEIEADTRPGNEIDSDLMRGARRGPGNGAGKAPIDRAVQVAAQDAFDLRMAPNHLGKSGGIIKAVIVHIGDTRREGRMMHHDDSWTLGLRGERCVEPGELIGAQRSAVLAIDQRIEGDEPQRVVFDCVMQMAVGRQIAVGAERCAQRRARIVIAGMTKTGIDSDANSARRCSYSSGAP